MVLPEKMINNGLNVTKFNDSKEMDETLWRDIPGLNGYQAHPDGKIRNKGTERVMLAEAAKHRYRQITIQGKNFMAHRLVALTFCPNPNPGKILYVNHKDGDKRNNQSNNLEWVTHSENVLDVVARGRKVKGPNVIPVRIIMYDGTINEYDSIPEAANNLDTNAETIKRCLYKKKLYYGPQRNRSKNAKWLWKAERIETGGPYEQRRITVKGFTHLYARSNGEIVNVNSNRVKGIQDDRYIRIKPSIKGGPYESKSAHQLIAMTFIPNPENKPIINHKDGNSKNNSVSNLEWCTQSENMIHANETGLISKGDRKAAADKTKLPVLKLELDGTPLEEICSGSEASKRYGEGIVTTCSTYRNPNLKTKRMAMAGYGWCLKKDFVEPRANTNLVKFFPELVGRKDVNFDKIRPFIIRCSKPVWQIEIDGTRVKMWNSMADAKEGLPGMADIFAALKSNFKKMAGGYFWDYASYEDILDPDREYDLVIPRAIRKALKISKTKGITLKPGTVDLLNQNISNNHLVIKTRPLYQLTLSGAIYRVWSSPIKAIERLGYGRCQIEAVLYGRTSTSNGYKWRWLTLREMCDGVPKK